MKWQDGLVWAECLHDCDGVVVEDCGHIFGGELVRGVTDEQTCLSDRTIADDNASVRSNIDD